MNITAMSVHEDDDLHYGKQLVEESNSPKRFDMNYMHRPPRIPPNYGRRRAVQTLPKSNVSRVLLYDNVTQQQMLDVKLATLTSERKKTERSLDLQRKSFLIRRMQKIQQLAGIGRDEERGFILPPLAHSALYPRAPLQHSPRPHQPPGKLLQHRTFFGDEASIHAVHLANTEDDLHLPQLQVTEPQHSTKVTFKVGDDGITHLMQTNHVEDFDTEQEQQQQELQEFEEQKDQEPQQQAEDVPIVEEAASDSVLQGVGSRKLFLGMRTSSDPRFLSLQSLLVRLERPCEGVWELSPSFRREASRVPYIIKKLGLARRLASREDSHHGRL